MKNVLFYIETYGKFANANGHIIEIIINELKKNENIKKIYIATTYNSTKELKKESNEKINIRRFSRSFNKKIENNLKEKKGKFYEFLLLTNSKVFQIKIRIFMWMWPLYSVTLILKYLFYFYKNRKNDIQTVVATYLHIEEVLAAIIIKKINPKINVILYSLDALSGRKSPEFFRTQFPKKSIERWETIIFNNIDYICAMESHKKYYESHKKYNQYRNKLIYFDIPYFSTRKLEKHIKKDRDINIVFTGTCSVYTGSPIYIIKIFSQMKNVVLHLYGTVDREIQKYIKINSFNNIVTHGKISREEIISIQNNADYLLNIGVDNECMVPCKIFEYISARRPIISTIKTDFDPSLPYLAKYNNYLIVDEREDIILNKEKIMNYINNSKYKEFDDFTLEKIYFNNTPYPFVELIEKIGGIHAK